jgi:hypothetical protein
MVSSDGKTYSIVGIGVFKLNGNNLERVQGGQGMHFHGSNSGFVPSAEGKFFVNYNRIYNSKLVALTPENVPQGFIVPSVSGQYYLRFQTESRGGMGGMRRRNDSGGDRRTEAKLFLFGDSRPIVSVPNLPEPQAHVNRGVHVAQVRNCLFIPEAEVIVALATNLQSLVLQKLNIMEALEDSGVDYLLVSSTAPETAKFGKTYEYQLEVKSKLGGVSFSLDSGPKGMKISDKGKITWTPSDETKEVEQKVIVTVRDSGEQEIFHTFSIDIPEVKEMALAAEAKAKADRAEKIRLQNIEKNKKRLAAMQKKAADRRKAALAKANGKAQTYTDRSSNAPRSYPIEDWIDSSGKHKIRAKFSHVEDQSKVVLIGENGTKKSIPLSRLGDKEIYRAVEYDLERLGKSKQARSSSPFKDEGSKGSSDALDPATMKEIIEAVERFENVLETSTDAQKMLQEILHPAMLEMLKENGRDIETLAKEFEDRGKLELLEALAGIDYTVVKVDDGVIKFRTRGPQIGFMKSDGKWYLVMR